MVPALPSFAWPGGGARPKPERALTRRVKANVFAQGKPRQTLVIYLNFYLRVG